MDQHNTSSFARNQDRETKKWEKLYQTPEMVKEQMRNWRSWGSWFSWGSPVGLGLFFISLAFAVLILHWAGWLWVK
jgi:hypothetical protein